MVVDSRSCACVNLCMTRGRRCSNRLIKYDEIENYLNAEYIVVNIISDASDILRSV